MLIFVAVALMINVVLAEEYKAEYSNNVLDAYTIESNVMSVPFTSYDYGAQCFGADNSNRGIRFLTLDCSDYLPYTIENHISKYGANFTLVYNNLSSSEENKAIEFANLYGMTHSPDNLINKLPSHSIIIGNTVFSQNEIKELTSNYIYKVDEKYNETKIFVIGNSSADTISAIDKLIGIYSLKGGSNVCTIFYGVCRFVAISGDIDADVNSEISDDELLLASYKWLSGEKGTIVLKELTNLWADN